MSCKECPTITIAFSRHLAPIKTSLSLMLAHFQQVERNGGK